MKTSQAVAVLVITCAERRSPIECGGTGSRRSAAAISTPMHVNSAAANISDSHCSDSEEPDALERADVRHEVADRSALVAHERDRGVAIGLAEQVLADFDEAQRRTAEAR